MTTMVFLAVAGALAGVCYGVAAVVREWFRGRALVIRAERGDPELPPQSYYRLPLAPPADE